MCSCEGVLDVNDFGTGQNSVYFYFVAFHFCAIPKLWGFLKKRPDLLTKKEFLSDELILNSKF